MLVMLHTPTLASGDARHANPSRNFRGKSKQKNWRREKDGPVSVIRLPLDASDPLVRHLTKALALHIADQVFEGASRHLFKDASGRTQGEPTIPKYFDFQMIPGRARSHTRSHKWETFRIHGSLAGHLGAYRAPGLSHEFSPAELVQLPPGTSIFAQPRHLKAPLKPKRSWWSYDGPICMVLSGIPALGDTDFVLPIRLPQGSGAYPHLYHHLGDPNAWHKVDLVRHQDASEPGGWRYEAHLMVLKEPYVSRETTLHRRQAAQLERRGCFDLNVSNCSVVSFNEAISEVRSTVIKKDNEEREHLEAEAKATRAKNRARDRSRRATNAHNYELSKSQKKRAGRRKAAGLPERQVELPRGPCKANAAGIPLQAYKKDALSKHYLKIRAEQAEAGAAKTRRKAARAKERAAEIVSTHGANLVTEAVEMSAWARTWGRGVHAFSPGMLRAAIEAEAQAVGRISGSGGVARASTRTTALSSHCICGARAKKALSERMHVCPDCGLVADRDLVSAALGSFVMFSRTDDPATARVDYALSRKALLIPGLKEALSESTASPSRRHSRRRDGRAAANRRIREASARRSAVRDAPTTPDEPAEEVLSVIDHVGARVHRAGLSRGVRKPLALRGRS